MVEQGSGTVVADSATSFVYRSLQSLTFCCDSRFQPVAIV
jgi:hypothetical protein